LPKTDPRNTGSYTIHEASRYLLVPAATLRSWTLGRKYPTSSGPRLFAPPVQIADKDNGLLSFLNLVEVHVLSSLTQTHGVPFRNIRRGLDTLVRLEKFSPSQHPLANRRFITDGRNLLIEELGGLVNLTEDGQLEMRKTIDAYLSRVGWGEDDYAVELYPYTTREHTGDQPRSIVMNPRISFGRPVLVGTGIATEVVAERYKAGESMQDLAKDYGRPDIDIQEAIRCELYRETG